MNLQSAQDTLQAAGFHTLRSHDAKSFNRSQMLDRNWIVVDQSPRAGTRISNHQGADLGAVRSEEYRDSRIGERVRCLSPASEMGPP